MGKGFSTYYNFIDNKEYIWLLGRREDIYFISHIPRTDINIGIYKHWTERQTHLHI